MALLGSILDPIVPETTVTLEGEGLLDVTDVLLWSPSGETSEPQPIVEQTDTSIQISVLLGDLPYAEDATLELVVGAGDNILEPVAVVPPPGVETAWVNTPASVVAVVTDAIPGLTLQAGNQIVQVGGYGEIYPDGTYDGTVEVVVWDATTETYSDPVTITSPRRRRGFLRRTVRGTIKSIVGGIIS